MTSNRMVFINLPVKNLNASVEFFTKLGFTFNPQFTDQNATCMIISDDAFVMLLVEDFFKTFTRKAMVDATKSTEVIVTLSANSRADVDDLVNKALAAGGKPSMEHLEMEGMYGWSFQDLDGHLWEVGYMDLSALGQAGN
jgi:uncharacterized protein